MCHYLTVRSLLEAKEYNEALQIINESEICANITQSGDQVLKKMWLSINNIIRDLIRLYRLDCILQ